jgi:hypothetical protein
MRPRIYTDTSVIGGCLDSEFRESSIRLMQLFRTGRAIMVFSDLTQLELDGAPPGVHRVLDTVPEAFKESIEVTDEASDLARRYIQEGVIVESKWVDAQHIALATVSRVDVLVSWNFKHIVNLERIRGYNGVNLKAGYPLLEIRTPQEVITHGN